MSNEQTSFLPDDMVNEVNNTNYSSGDYPVIAPGEYQVIVTKFSVGPTKNGEGQRATVGMQIVGGQHHETNCTAFLNIINKSPVAQNIARGNLKNLFLCAGFPAVTKDGQALIGKKVRVKVTVNSQSQNDFKFLESSTPNGRVQPSTSNTAKPTNDDAAPW